MNSPSQTPSLIASETRRFKLACLLVLALGVGVVATILAFGNAPRPVVNQMNLILAPVCVLAFVILAASFWRFRSRCGDWPR